MTELTDSEFLRQLAAALLTNGPLARNECVDRLRNIAARIDIGEIAGRVPPAFYSAAGTASDAQGKPIPNQFWLDFGYICGRALFHDTKGECLRAIEHVCEVLSDRYPALEPLARYANRRTE